MKNLMRILPIVFLCMTMTLSAFAADSQPIIMGGSKNIGIVPLIALKKGYFAEQGLNVEYQEIQVGKLAMDALVAGKIDVGFLMDMNIAFGGFQDAPIRVIASIVKRGDDAIIYRKDSKIDKALDLKGKKIGYYPGTASHAFLDRFLKLNKLTMKDITPVILQISAMQPAIEGGQVDAVACWQPWCQNILNTLSDKVGIFKNTASIYPSEGLLATRTDILEKRPEDLKKMLTALIKAEKFIKENPAEAQNIMAEQMHLSPDMMHQIWPDMGPAIELTPSILTLVQQHGAWITDSMDDFKGQILPDYKKFFDPSLLKQIDPKRVEGKW